MGRNPGIYEAGDPCWKCWGAGKEFGDYPTPKHVLATFSGIPPPYESGNGTYLLWQRPEDACEWVSDEKEYICFWEHLDITSSLTIRWVGPPWEHVWQGFGDLCATHFAAVGVTGVVT